MLPFPEEVAILIDDPSVSYEVAVEALVELGWDETQAGEFVAVQRDFPGDS